jgi:hypothetical protein
MAKTEDDEDDKAVAESQLLALLRGEDIKSFILTIEWLDGAWEIVVCEPPSEELPRGGRARGVGATFHEAWHSIAGLQF